MDDQRASSTCTVDVLYFDDQACICTWTEVGPHDYTPLDEISSIGGNVTITWRVSRQRLNKTLLCLELDDQKKAN
jgi:hypothetical protein